MFKVLNFIKILRIKSNKIHRSLLDNLLNYIYLLYLILFIIIFIYYNESLCLCSANIFYIYIDK